MEALSAPAMIARKAKITIPRSWFNPVICSIRSQTRSDVSLRGHGSHFPHRPHYLAHGPPDKPGGIPVFPGNSMKSWCCWRGLNSRPLPYQGSALPLSYSSHGRAFIGRRRRCRNPHNGSGRRQNRESTRASFKHAKSQNILHAGNTSLRPVLSYAGSRPAGSPRHV